MSQCIHFRKKMTYGILASVMCCVLVACAKTVPSADWKPGDTASITVNETPLQVELAMTPTSQAKGLMKRKSLPNDHGMLFIFDRPEPRSFWMKNTWIPLDIAYIDSSGVIKEIHAMYPNNQNSVHSHSKEIQFALETNRNWFKENNIRPGATIDLDPILPIMTDNGIFCELNR